MKLEAFRAYWKKKGIIKFAEEYLTYQPDFPPHPDLGRIPPHIVLSPEQKAFLEDFMSGTKKLLVCGARSSGKTFLLAILILFLLIVEPYYKVNFMGGSSEQSSLCQDYIDFWRDTLEEIKAIIKKSTRGLKPKILTIWGSRCDFKACSQASARGSHVPLLILDEACTAESRDIDSRKAVKASYWQVVGKPNSRLIMTSTANFLLGDFYKYLKAPQEYGFSLHKWSIARHKSGKPNLAVYSDKNKENWLPNMWYVDVGDIQDLRKRSDDSTWLVEALGEVALSSGFVFKRTDLELAVCSLCEECEPYKWGHCRLIEKYRLGDAKNPTKHIGDRKAGYDYGAVSPNALTIAGRKGSLIFVLFSSEIKGVRVSELMSWISENCEQHKAYTIIPDPSIGGQAISEALSGLGFAIYVIDSQRKDERIFNLRGLVERHLMIIPKAFTYLIESLKTVSYDERGKIRKLNDHSFDSLCYVTFEWSPEESGFPKGIKGVKLWND